MGQIIIRDLDDNLLDRLKQRAEINHRTLEDELRAILLEATTADRREKLSQIDRIRAMTPRRLTTDSAALIREDRDTR
jgi:plasmid stability protein